jgi:hypothetical protein
VTAFDSRSGCEFFCFPTKRHKVVLNSALTHYPFAVKYPLPVLWLARDTVSCTATRAAYLVPRYLRISDSERDTDRRDVCALSADPDATGVRSSGADI